MANTRRVDPKRPSLTAAQRRVLDSAYDNQPIQWFDLLRIGRVKDSATITRLTDLGLLHETRHGLVAVTALGEATVKHKRRTLIQRVPSDG